MWPEALWRLALHQDDGAVQCEQSLSVEKGIVKALTLEDVGRQSILANQICHD